MYSRETLWARPNQLTCTESLGPDGSGRPKRRAGSGRASARAERKLTIEPGNSYNAVPANAFMVTAGVIPAAAMAGITPIQERGEADEPYTAGDSQDPVISPSEIWGTNRGSATGTQTDGRKRDTL